MSASFFLPYQGGLSGLTARSSNRCLASQLCIRSVGSSSSLGCPGAKDQILIDRLWESMGCASSRVMHLQAERDDAPVPLDSGGTPTPTPKKSRKRRYGEHEQQQQQQHVVELTSSTYGILELNHVQSDQQPLDATKCLKHKTAAADRTPSKVRGLRNSVEKPEVINALELMEGLEENLALGFSSPLSSSKLHRRSMSLSAVHAAQMVQAVLSNKEAAAGLQLLLRDMHSSNVGGSTKALSKQKQQKQDSGKEEKVRPREDFYVMSQTSQHPRGSSSSSTTQESSQGCWTSNKKRCLSSKASNSFQVSPASPLNGADSPPLFDPELLETIERAFEQISEEDWYSARRSNGAFVSTSRSVSPASADQRPVLLPVKSSKGNKIPAGGSFKQKPVEAQSCKATSYYELEGSIVEAKQSDEMLHSFQLLCPPGGEGKAVLYFTSLRGVRNTFEECTSMLTVLRGYGVSIDERDVSMHLGFRHELRELFGSSSKPVQVPKLFVKGRFIGGAPEVSRLHDEGSLGKLLEGIGREDPSKLCDGCGSARFVLCLDCSGSCKVLMDDGKGTTRCLECNENGLIRCPICC